MTKFNKMQYAMLLSLLVLAGIFAITGRSEISFGIALGYIANQLCLGWWILFHWKEM